MAVLFTAPYVYFTDDDGAPLAGGKVYTYAAGTTAPKATYTTAAGNIENANPVVLDASGRAVIFIDGAYKFTITDANDVVIRTVDNVSSFTTLDSQSDPFFESFSGNGTQTAFTMSEDLGTEEKAIYVWVDSGLQNHVTNGTFATDTDWTKGSGWTIAAGVATASGALSTAIEQTAGVTLIAGESYNVTMTITRSAGSLTPSVGGVSGTARSSSATFTETIIAGSTQTIAFTGSGFTGTLDSVTVTPAVGRGYTIVPPTGYTINGTALTFNTAPATGTGNVLVSAPLLTVGAASSAAAAAQAAESGALAAQAAAELAETHAETAETNAELAETNAEAAQVLAEAARDTAIAAAGSASLGNISALSTATPATGDFLPFQDITDSNLSKRATIGDVLNLVPAPDPSGWVPILTQSASNSAQVDFINGTGGVVLDSTYKAYAVVYSKILLASETAFAIRASNDGGSSWGTSDHSYFGFGGTDAASTVAGYSSAASDRILLASTNSGNDAGESISGVVYFTLADGTRRFQCTWNTVYQGTSSQIICANGAGQRITNTTTNAVGFKSASGNITSGTFTLYGLADA